MTNIKITIKTLNSIEKSLASDKSEFAELNAYFDKMTLIKYGKDIHSAQQQLNGEQAQLNSLKSQLQKAETQLNYAIDGYKKDPVYVQHETDVFQLVQETREATNNTMYYNKIFMEESVSFQSYFSFNSNTSFIGKAFSKIIGHDKWKDKIQNTQEKLLKWSEKSEELEEKTFQAKTQMETIKEDWSIEYAPTVKQLEQHIQELKTEYSILQKNTSQIENQKDLLQQKSREHIVQKIKDMPAHHKESFAKSLVQSNSSDLDTANMYLLLSINSIHYDTANTIRTIDTSVKDCIQTGLSDGGFSSSDFSSCADVSSTHSSHSTHSSCATFSAGSSPSPSSCSSSSSSCSSSSCGGGGD